MSGGHAGSGTPARYSAAAVHLVLQTRPGPAADRRITTGGTATVTLHSGAVLEVAPVIAKLDMQTLPLVEVRLWGHLLTVEQTGTGD